MWIYIEFIDDITFVVVQLTLALGNDFLLVQFLSVNFLLIQFLWHERMWRVNVCKNVGQNVDKGKSKNSRFLEMSFMDGPLSAPKSRPVWYQTSAHFLVSWH